MGKRLKIAITGASGMLGTALIDLLGHKYDVFATSRTVGYKKSGVQWASFDLLNTDALVSWLNKVSPDIVIHCAALVNVDACEEQIDYAKKLHIESTQKINETISNWNGKLIYISTDAVFDGTKKDFYNETDIPLPLSIYGKTKYAGEVVTLTGNNNLVLRTTIIGWSFANKLSFAEWVLQGLVEQRPLNMFTDVIFSPIHVTHLAEVIDALFKSNCSGIFNVSGNSFLSKYEFGIKMGEMFNLPVTNIEPSSIDKAGLTALRPKNMALSNKKITEALNLKLPCIEETISLLKKQYDTGWLNSIKNRNLKSDYRFWEAI